MNHTGKKIYCYTVNAQLIKKIFANKGFFGLEKFLRGSFLVDLVQFYSVFTRLAIWARGANTQPKIFFHEVKFANIMKTFISILPLKG